MEAGGNVLILAAGQGKRMRSPLPKVLHELCGRPMLGWVLEQALALDPERVVVVVGQGAEAVEAFVRAMFGSCRPEIVRQAEQLGTGHAARCALPALLPGAPTVVLYGDMPALASATLAELVRTRRESGAAAALLTAEPPDARGFGRIVRRPDGATLERIVEERDCTPDQRAIREVNVGVYAFAAGVLHERVPELDNANAQGEYYLTDVPGALAASGRGVLPVPVADADEVIGVNTLAQLAEARGALQERILEGHLAAGVRIEDPATTYVDWDVQIGPGTRILPCTVIRGGVRIGADCEVGPFTHLRPGTVLEDGAEVGNFTEAKNAVVGAGTKAKHLSYLGDVRIGAGANIGAGTIVANYDGKQKHRTVIGDRAFVGSGSILIAPAEVGRGALTGAGAVVTRGSKIPDGEAWVGVPARRIRSAGEGR